MTEYEFWTSTIAELERAIQSRQRVQEQQKKQKANFDYILADLIGRSISRIYSSSATMPDIESVYPSLFSVDEEEEQQRKDDLSVIRFKQFAEAFNNHLEGVKND